MINAERLKEIETKPLHKGSGTGIDQACVMQMVSYVAGEKWTDQPECACPVLTWYAIRLNDRFDDKHRQLMKPFIPMLVGTRSTPESQIARKRLIRWRNVTVTYPLILETIKLNDLAEKLRAFENTLESMALAAKFLQESRALIEKTYRADAYADAYANANANANAYAYANANANANADAYANANAYAYAFREKIANVALETLRMAIEVKATN
jgi:hypothetical protein